ncbi:MAG: hypothetical protein AAFR58_10380 [Cyanobacteria bacterium J06627_28]
MSQSISPNNISQQSSNGHPTVTQLLLNLNRYSTSTVTQPQQSLNLNRYSKLNRPALMKTSAEFT